MADYIAYLHKEPSSDYGVSFPDFPGAVTAGRTLEEAKNLAGALLALQIQGMIEDGEVIPKPSALDDLSHDPALQGAVAFLVAGPVQDRTVRFNITAHETQLAEITHRASKAGLNRSTYMVQAALGRQFAVEPVAAANRGIYKRKKKAV